MLGEMSSRRTAAFAAAALILTACPKEPTEQPKPQNPKKTIAPIEAKKPLTIAEAKPTGCEPAPVWVGIEACQLDGAVYATGRKTIQSSGRLTRAVVAARARSAAGVAARIQAEDGNMRMKDAEVLYVHRCKDEWIGLAKVAGDPPATLAGCPKDLLSKPPVVPKDCPPWVGRVGWKEGDTYHGVGSLPMKKNNPLAHSGAKARALTMARAVATSVVGVDGRSASIDSTSQGLGIMKNEVVACDGRIWAHVIASTNAPTPEEIMKP